MNVSIIQDRCKNEGISIMELEKRTGLANGVIGKWRDGSVPRLDNVQKVADYFHCGIDDLIVGRETFTNETT